MSVLAVSGIVAGYSRADTILKGVSATADAGEIVAVLGPNGAGKSTLLKAITGQVTVREGHVRVGEDDITGRRPREVARAGVAYVPQEANVFATMTVRENLEIGVCERRGGAVRGGEDDITGRRPREVARAGVAYVPQEANVFATMTVRENLEIGGYVEPKAAAGRIETLFARFPVLAEKRRDAARTLSGGQRQLLAMAIAMMVEPKLLLLDEPSAGLSPIAAREMFDTIRQIAATGVAVVLVEQNALDALDLADRAYILAAGQNHTEGTGADLAADPDIRRTFLGGQ